MASTKAGSPVRALRPHFTVILRWTTARHLCNATWS
jgi:hypothetical protein